MSIWAHPDDESFLAAGLLATAVKNGQTVVCVTATKGEAGVQDEARWPRNKLGEIRAQEMAAAMKLLGITNHHWLDYADGGCVDANTDEAVDKLCVIAQQIKPDTILTFGPDGWTGHPDHTTMSRWADVLVTTLGKKIAIYHVTHTPEHFEKYYKKADEQFNFFFNIDQPPLLPKQECDIHYQLPADIKALKYRALKSMVSQTERLFLQYDPELLDKAWAVECFHKAGL